MYSYRQVIWDFSNSRPFQLGDRGTIAPFGFQRYPKGPDTHFVNVKTGAAASPRNKTEAKRDLKAGIIRPAYASAEELYRNRPHMRQYHKERSK